MTPTLLAQIDGLRAQSLGLLDQLADQARDFELPAPPEAMSQFRQKLAENTYKVLVVGEAKRGKSSFINALIGRPILPTDVDIATSQVFLVNKAAHEAYRLRFEDGSSEDITANDLTKYGSQVLADVEGTPRLDQIIRWIEVDAPVRFLPDGMSVLDTPGLGSLYAAHSQITQRFIPYADAVVYILDSSQPIGQPDLKTIEAILAVTTHLFFIQTHIDQFRKEQWQAILTRNEQVLRERFGAQLASVRVWPISSTNLMTAAETNDEDYEIVSRHRELAAAFKTFLFRVAGLCRVAGAMAVAGQYHHSARQVLLGRAADLAEQSKERRAALQREMAQRQRDFDSTWGEHGPKRQALIAALQRATAAGKQDLRQALDSGGEIDRAARVRIDQTTSLEETKYLADTLEGEVTQAAVKKWQGVNGQIHEYSVQMLGPFIEAMQDLTDAIYTDTVASGPIPERYTLETPDNWFERAKGARLDFMHATAMAGIGGGAAAFGLSAAAGSSTLVASILASSLIPPLAVFLAVGAGIWAVAQGFGGWKRVEQTQLKSAQQELHKHLVDVRERVRRFYFNVDLKSGRLQSLVDEHFDQLVTGVSETLQRLAVVKSAEARDEQARLAEQAKLDEQQRAARLAELRGHVAQWDQVGQDLQQIGQALTAIDQALQALHRPQPQDQQT